MNDHVHPIFANILNQAASRPRQPIATKQAASLAPVPAGASPATKPTSEPSWPRGVPQDEEAMYQKPRREVVREGDE